MRRFRFVFFLFAFLAVTVHLACAATSTQLLEKPIVVVYPLGVASGVDKEAASRLAVLFATTIAEGGECAVKPAPPGTERADYRTEAIKLKADYYVSGYVTPIGDEVSIVEQVVSVDTGIVIFSNTAQVKTYNDVNGQGEILRNAIVRHAYRNLGAILSPVDHETPAPTAAPSGGTAAKIGGLGGLLGRKRRQATPSPSPAPAALAAIGKPVPAVSEPPIITPVPVPSLLPRSTTPPANAPPTAVPTAVPPSRPTASAKPTASPIPLAAAGSERRFAVVPFGGSAAADARAYAADRTVAAIGRNGFAAELIDGSSRDIDQHAADYCATAKAVGIVTATLGTKNGDPLYGKTTDATLELAAYACDGKALYRKTFDREGAGTDDAHRAIDNAVDAAVGAYLTPPKKKRR